MYLNNSFNSISMLKYIILSNVYFCIIYRSILRTTLTQKGPGKGPLLKNLERLISWDLPVKA